MSPSRQRGTWRVRSAASFAIRMHIFWSSARSETLPPDRRSGLTAHPPAGSRQGIVAVVVLAQDREHCEHPYLSPALHCVSCSRVHSWRRVARSCTQRSFRGRASLALLRTSARDCCVLLISAIGSTSGRPTSEHVDGPAHGVAAPPQVRCLVLRHALEQLRKVGVVGVGANEVGRRLPAAPSASRARR